MSQADKVRQFAYDTFIAPARKRGYETVSIRAGDIANARGLSGRVPLVCGALGAMKFRAAHDLALVRIDGPGQSTTTTFVFALGKKKSRFGFSRLGLRRFKE